MNFYNPYYVMPTTTNLGRGLFSSTLRNGINWSGILNGAQRTLGLVNQAIPLVKQAAPMFRNAKTMFKVMNEFKKVETPNTNVQTEKVNNQSYNQPMIVQESTPITTSSGPTFFI